MFQLYMEVRHQNILQQARSESVKIMSSNVNIFCLEHFYTIRYNTFLHTFFMLYNISKVSFLYRSNGYQCGMRIPQPGFNSQSVPDHGC